MAARENQGLQIALIIFVMLTIVLIVTTFLFFRNYQTEQISSKAADTKRTEAETAARNAIAESQDYKNMIGAATTDTKDTIAAASKKDLEKHGKTLPESEQNYRALVKFLSTELAGANTRIAEITAQKAELAEKLKADEAAKIAEIAKYTDTVTTTAKDLESERQKFDKDRKEITTNKEQLAKKFDDKRKEHDDLTKKSTEQIASMTKDKSNLTSLLTAMNEEKKRGESANEIPDGKITWVNQRSRLVWINLGSDDGLRPQTMFSVYAVDDAITVSSDDKPKPSDTKSKGKVEVVRLMDRHMAEARVVDDDLSNPMMPGDQVFSPTFEPGRPEHFALVGFIDVDGDGTSDRQRVRDLIALNGGVIDAEVTENGKSTGEMTINTNYVVIGDPPKVGENVDKDANIAAYSDAMGKASTLGVKTVPVKRFLDYMGYKPEDRTVNLGKNTKAADFTPRLPEGVQRIAPGSAPKEFRKPALKSGKIGY